MKINYLRKRTWLDVDIDVLEENYNVIRKHIPSSAKLCCTIKADAYGHGARRIAKLYSELGADLLSVSNIEEAIQIRNANVGTPILVLGYTPVNAVEILAENNISQCVYSYEYGRELLDEAKKHGVKVKIHVKLDTGMGRIGFLCRNENLTHSVDEICELCSDEAFICEGIFTHFARADETNGELYTKTQYNTFCQMIDILSAKGIAFNIRHCANSAAIIDYPYFSMDMVRAGIALYGFLPSDDIKNKSLLLREAVTLKSIISHVKKVERGEGIGYGSSFIAQNDMTVATVPIGYADGFRREYASKVKIYVHGKPCDILGRICMDQLMIDVSKVGEIVVGEEISLFGCNCEVSAQEFARLNSMIPYELICDTSTRVPKIYYKNGQIESVLDYLLI